jgi:hypothetical protein
MDMQEAGLNVAKALIKGKNLMPEDILQLGVDVQNLFGEAVKSSADVATRGETTEANAQTRGEQALIKQFNDFSRDLASFTIWSKQMQQLGKVANFDTWRERLASGKDEYLKNYNLGQQLLDKTNIIMPRDEIK